MDAATRDLQRAIFQGKIARARATPAADKIAEAAALWDDTVALMRDAIATDRPDFDPDQVHAELLRRLEIARRLDAPVLRRRPGTTDGQS